MPTSKELEAKFWKALKSDMTMMLGLDGVEDGHTRPMTAQIEGEEGGPIWFFTAKDNMLVRQAEKGRAQSRHSPRKDTTCLQRCTVASMSTPIVRSSTGYGTAMSPPGMREARMIQSLRSLKWTRKAPKSGWTAPVW